MALATENGDYRSFELLSQGECLWLLETASIGRVGVTIGALPAIFPVNYAMEGGDIYFLSGEGTKLTAALRGVPVAFQIDSADFEYHQGWSVLAVGVAVEVDGEEAVLLRRRLALEPWAPGPRDHLVRIRPELLSGRRIGFLYGASPR